MAETSTSADAPTRAGGTTRRGRVLLGYAALHGQPSVIADAVARRLRAHGHVVEAGDPCVAPMPPPEDYDCIVLGLPVGFGPPRRSIARYIIDHRAGLAELPVALFIVSARHEGDAGEFLAEFLRWLDWQPDRAAAFVAERPFARGSLRTYLARVVGSLRRASPPPSTDWAAVARFADAIAADLAALPLLAPRFETAEEHRHHP